MLCRFEFCDYPDTLHVFIFLARPDLVSSNREGFATEFIRNIF
jgi:hypothetical protein